MPSRKNAVEARRLKSCCGADCNRLTTLPGTHKGLCPHGQHHGIFEGTHPGQSVSVSPTVSD